VGEMHPRLLRKLGLEARAFYLEIALDAVGVEPASHALGHIAALIGFGLLFTIIAFIAYRRDEGKTYG